MRFLKELYLLIKISDWKIIVFRHIWNQFGVYIKPLQKKSAPLKTVLIDFTFGIYIQVIPKNNIGYINLIFEITKHLLYAKHIFVRFTLPVPPLHYKVLFLDVFRHKI